MPFVNKKGTCAMATLLIPILLLCDPLVVCGGIAFTFAQHATCTPRPATRNGKR